MQRIFLIFRSIYYDKYLRSSLNNMRTIIHTPNRWKEPQPGSLPKYRHSRPMTKTCCSRERVILNAFDTLPGLPEYAKSDAFKSAATNVLFHITKRTNHDQEMSTVSRRSARKALIDAIAAISASYYKDYDIPDEFTLRTPNCPEMHIPAKIITPSKANQQTYKYYLRLFFEAVDLFGRNSTAHEETQVYSHHLLQSAFAIDAGFKKGGITGEDRALFDKFCFLILPAIKLCGFSVISTILHGQYTNIMSAEDGSAAAFFFDLPLKQLEALSNYQTAANHVLDRAMFFHLKATDAHNRSVHFAANFAKHADRIAGATKHAGSPYNTVYINCLKDIAAGNTKRKAEIERIMSCTFSADRRLNESCLTDPCGLEAAGISRISRYRIDYETTMPDATGQLNRKYFGTFLQSAGQPRNHQSTFISRRRIDSGHKEIDTPFLCAIQSQKPCYGLAYKYNNQPPFWILPVVESGEVTELVMLEMQRYYCAPDIRLDENNHPIMK